MYRNTQFVWTPKTDTMTHLVARRQLIPVESIANISGNTVEV